MAERKIEPALTYGIEAFIDKRGTITLKQYDPFQEKETLIQIEFRDVDTICQWLTELREEAWQAIVGE